MPFSTGAEVFLPAQQGSTSGRHYARSQAAVEALPSPGHYTFLTDVAPSRDDDGLTSYEILRHSPEKQR